jgi:hypothetical protein
MSDRRAARESGKIRKAAAGPMPAELMSGPCIEDWVGRSKRPDWAQSHWPAFQAMRNWQAAVDLWAVESGWATERRPASNACNLARTRRPWSRVYLIEHGCKSLVDYYEGRRVTRPETDGLWHPTSGRPEAWSTTRSAADYEPPPF